MKTFYQFLEAYTEKEAAKIAPAMAPEKRRAALEKNARNQARMKATDNALQRRRTPQKALPPTSKLAKRPADKGSDIVRSKRGGTGKEGVGVPRKSGPGVKIDNTTPKGTGTKTYERTRPKGGALSKVTGYRSKPDGVESNDKHNRKMNREKQIADIKRKRGQELKNKVKNAAKTVGKGIKGGASLTGKGIKGGVGLAKKAYDIGVKKTTKDIGSSSGEDQSGLSSRDTKV